MVKIRKIMLSIIVVLGFSIGLLACTGGASAKQVLDQAATQLSVLFDENEQVSGSIADRLISDSEVEIKNKTYLVLVSWDTDNHAVIDPSGAVTRPDGDTGGVDTTVKLTAVISYVEKVGKTPSTKTINWTLTVKATAPFAGEILANIETLYDRYAGPKPTSSSEVDPDKIYASASDTFRILDVVVIMVCDTYYYIADGTASVQVYVSSHGRTVGEKGRVTGYITDYSGLPELAATTVFVKTSDNNPLPQVPIDDGLTALMSSDAVYNNVGKTAHVDDYASLITAAQRNADLHKIYKITGTVVLATNSTYTSVWAARDSANAATYPDSHRTDEQYQLYIADSSSNPEKVVRIHGSNSTFNAIKALDGSIIELTVISHTFRDSYPHVSKYSKTATILPIWYVSVVSIGELSAEQKVLADAAGLSVTDSFIAPGTIDLPSLGGQGSAIAWSYTSLEDTNNSLINLTTGAVVLPSSIGTVAEVKLTATITNGGASATKDFVIKVGQLQISEIGSLDFSTHTSDALGLIVRVKATLTQLLPFYSTGTLSSYSGFVEDATGGLYLYSIPSSYASLLVVGNTLDITGWAYTYNGCDELVGNGTHAAQLDIKKVEPSIAVTPEVIDDQTVSVDLLNKRISATGVLSKVGSVYSLLVSENGKYTIYLPAASGYSDGAASVNALAEKLNGAVDKEVAIVANFYRHSSLDKIYILSVDQVTVNEGAISDSFKVLIDKTSLDIATKSFNAAGTITLPVAGDQGSTIAWSFKNGTDVNNSLINLGTGAVTLPQAEGTVSVVIVATLTVGEASSTKEFTISITKPAAGVLSLSWEISNYGGGGELSTADCLTAFLGLIDGEHEEYLISATSSAKAYAGNSTGGPGAGVACLKLGSGSAQSDVTLTFSPTVLISKVTVNAAPWAGKRVNLDINGDQVLVDNGTSYTGVDYSITLTTPSNEIKIGGIKPGDAGADDPRIVIYSITFEYTIVTPA